MDFPGATTATESRGAATAATAAEAGRAKTAAEAKGAATAAEAEGTGPPKTSYALFREDGESAELLGVYDALLEALAAMQAQVPALPGAVRRHRAPDPEKPKEPGGSRLALRVVTAPFNAGGQ